MFSCVGCGGGGDSARDLEIPGLVGSMLLYPYLSIVIETDTFLGSWAFCIDLTLHPGNLT